MNKIFSKKKNILVIAAHPDDEILGCGATIARLANEGCEINTLILGEGITSRDEKRKPKKRASELKTLKEQARRANDMLGVKKVFMYCFPDNRFDTVPLLDIVKTIEKVKNETEPDIIFTHFKDDLNIDHQITYKAVLTAVRPQPDEKLIKLYSFMVLSSTEWSFGKEFSPNTFIDVSRTFDKKIKAFKTYKDEMQVFPHPRSAQALEISAQYWGMRVGINLAEVFLLVRNLMK